MWSWARQRGQQRKWRREEEACTLPAMGPAEKKWGRGIHTKHCVVCLLLPELTLPRSFSWDNTVGLFQIYTWKTKIIDIKCCIQYASKFGKSSSGSRTGKGQFSFQSQRRVMLKNVQTTEELHSFYMLARKCSKFFKLGFNSMWTKNFWMYKLVFEEAEEPEIKLPTTVGS